ncbi:uncharacterized protein LOC114328825 isoform X2 [Diabrotica virgifera virgifera]|uniref:Uncharacterized protein LOC114328825 isoform X2 n=1 Tax=Diabrotica virgifera virgifera TaxID=50390 RepID=A0A6P7FK74_DIAVI|nr:uncharacterized protein LOC114328825 isoform X2 [Diabrotica virgifera virgifera]
MSIQTQSHSQWYIPPKNREDYLTKLALLSVTMFGVYLVTQLFYFCYVRYWYRNFTKTVIQKGRLISVLPIISTIGATMPVHVNVQQTVNVPNAPQQNTYPPNAYTAPDGSRMFDDKVAPPAYVP